VAPAAGSPSRDELPLSEAHLRHLQASAISLEVIAECGFRTVETPAELEELGFTRRQASYVPGILIPWHFEGGIVGHQFRPDRPRQDLKGRVLKYEVPKGSSLRLDMPPACQHAAGDPSVPLFVTEGSKKAASIVSRGGVAISIAGVWAWRGKNQRGGLTLLSDWDVVALNGRKVYLGFDNDIVTKPPVAAALRRFTANLERKGANVSTLLLPPGENGAKVGVDDYLAAGHTLEDLEALASDTPPEEEKADFELEHDLYCTVHGRICMRKNGLVPLGNFAARIAEEVILDDGVEQKRYVAMDGELDGRELKRVQVPINQFESMSWLLREWGTQVIIRAGSSSREHLRCAIQAMSNLNGREPVRIYQHTGWRMIDGERIFLGGAGAIGRPDIRVEIPSSLSRYALPIEPGDVDIREAIRASLSFLDISSRDVTYALWAAQYLAPLAEELEPAFTLWLLGRTGSYKSVLSALAVSHFGNFTHTELPASWEGTANYLERAASLLKDHPLVIDDYPPGVTTAAARDLETKVERVIRSQGNKSGRGRLQSDTNFRSSYVPRGLIITSGEQLPSSESGGARLFVVQVEEAATDPDTLTFAQDEEQGLYRFAMADYCSWLQKGWDSIIPHVHEEWEGLRHLAMEHGIHRRLPAVVACMTVAFRTAMAWAMERGAITATAAEEKSAEAWELFLRLADQQGSRVNEQRPATRFLDALSTLLLQRRVYLIDRTRLEPTESQANAEFIGWFDSTRLYLLPDAAFKEVYAFCLKGGQPLQFKPAAVWADLARLLLIEAKDDGGKPEYTKWVRVGHGREESKSQRVISLSRNAVDGMQVQAELEGVM